MARRENEAVAPEPGRVLGVDPQELRPEDVGDLGHSHGHSRVAAASGLDGVHGQDSNRVAAELLEVVA